MTDIQEYIKQAEGFTPKAKWDHKQYSIGYGTATDNPDEVIDESEALIRMQSHIDKDREYITQIGEANNLSWTANEMDALTSFTYNLGRGNLEKLVTGRDKDTIGVKMLEYIHASGKVSDGLVDRRTYESELFFRKVEEAVEGDTSQLTADELGRVEPLEIQGDVSRQEATDIHVPMSLIRKAEDERKALEESATFKNLWKPATDRHWVMNSLDRWDRAEFSDFNPAYVVKTEDVIKYNDAGYSDEELSFLFGSSSENNFDLRLEMIQDNRERYEQLEKGGMTGTMVEMLASVSDPALLPSFLLGAAGVSTKWRSIKAITASMLSGSSQAVATEYLLRLGDTKRSDRDLLLAAASGAVFSGAITAGFHGYGKIKEMRTKMRLVNKADADLVNDIKSAVTYEVYNVADKALAEEIPSATQRRVFMTEKEIIQKLKEEVGDRKVTLSNKKVKAAKEEFRAFKKAREARKAEIRAMLINKPSSRMKLLAEEDRLIAERKEVLDATLEANAIAVKQNSALDALQQGKIPESLKQRYDELKAESGEIDIDPSNVSKSLRKGLVEEPEAPVKEGGDELSVGAMQTRAEFSDIETNEGLLTKTEVEEIEQSFERAQDFGRELPRISRLATMAKGFRSISTILDTAPDDATRGIAGMLFKNATRTIPGHHSAAELSETLWMRNVPDYISHYQAFDNYLKEQNVGPLSKRVPELLEEFEKQVVLLQASGRITNNEINPADDALTAAAKARSRIYERSLENYKTYGVVGFDKVEHSHAYHSVVYDPARILSFGDDATADVKNVIAIAYQNGGIKLTRENAVRLASLQVDRATSYRSGGNGTFKTTLSDSELNELELELRERGLDDDVLDDIKQSLFNKEELQHMSPRAMFSLKPDLSAVSGDVRLVDLIDTSTERVMKYASDSAAMSGIAKQGFKSLNQLRRTIEEARTAAQDELRSLSGSTNPKVAKEASKNLDRLDETYQLIDDGIKLLFREPVGDGRISDSLEEGLKILRKQASIVQLRSTGWSVLPEYSTALLRNGAINTLKQIPHSRFFDLREESIIKDKFMDDFSRALTPTGHQEALFAAKYYNNSDFDDVAKGRIAKVIQKYQGKMGSVTMTVNLFRSAQHGGEDMVARSIISNLTEMAVKGEITPNIRKSLMDVGGLSEDQIDEMIQHFNKHKDVDMFESLRLMRPDLNHAVSTAVRNTIGSSFMKLGVGEQVPYANKELGKMMTHLLNFSIGSWEKLVVRGIKSDGPAMLSAMVATNAALALMAQYAYVYSRSQGMDGQERKEFLAKNLDNEYLFWGAFNKMSYMAAPSIPLQVLAGAGLLPDAITASPNKAGVQSASLPVIGMANNTASAIGSSADLMSNVFNDEYMTNEERERNWANLRRVMPWINSPVYNFTIGQLD